MADLELVSADVGYAVANGPDDGPLDWDQVDWRSVERDVQRLRQRIFAAERAGDHRRVANLQKLMLRSRSNTLLSVRQVTELNAGRKTAGVDGKVAWTSQDKADLVERLQRATGPWQARPVKRVYIPKSKGKFRPLGIPTIADRAQQNRVRHALESQWEARFEPRSYGFRPGRGCHDAIQAVYNVANGKTAKRLWALDADLKAAFDHIDHDLILGQLGGFPGRAMIRAWLRAGVVEKGEFFATEEGTPQGGGISPVLLNIALHGMEAAAGVRYYTSGSKAGWVRPGSPVLVRYADDSVVLCHSRRQADQVKQRLVEWLRPRGLVFNEDKTQIVHLETQGFDFLGFTIRRFHGKLLIRPSAAAVRRIRERLRTEMRALRGANAAAVTTVLSPIIRGQAAYYRTGVSSKTFASLDAYVWALTYKWAKRSHPNKPRHWVTARYFGRFNKARNDKWVFGDRHSGAYLPKYAWVGIVRHVMVTGAASPDDPTLAQYWADRRRKRPPPPMSRSVHRALRAQQGRCSACGGLLLAADQPPDSPSQWEQWLRMIRKVIDTRNIVITGQDSDMPSGATIRLIHAFCRRRTMAEGPAFLQSRSPSGLA